MRYARALAAREEALARCLFVRQELRAAADESVEVYRAYPVPALTGAAGLGFVLAQLRVGSGLVATGARLATGPAFELLRRFLQI